MKRPVTSARLRSISPGPPRGYTLVEILVATALALLLMAAVVRIFGQIGESVSAARSTLEMSDRLRAAQTTLKKDLEGLTVTMLPPRHPKFDEGYFEYKEGPFGPVRPVADPQDPNPFAVRSDPDNPGNVIVDTTVGDVDEVLMFTTRSTSRPFTGRVLVRLADGRIRRSAESQIAEVAWFVRGTTLYRRVLLVLPEFDADLEAAGIQTQLDADGNEVPFPYPGFYADYDLSVRRDGNTLVANTLADLTRRECRFAHDPRAFPFDVSAWGQLGLPTLRECSSSFWLPDAMAPGNPPISSPPVTFEPSIDYWDNPHPWQEVDRETGSLNAFLDGPRIAEDVILTNVIRFDVKLWDPGAPVITDGDVVLSPGDRNYAATLVPLASGWTVLHYGAYVDLGYAPGYDYTTIPGAPQPLFHDVNYDYPPPGPQSGLWRVYDTWSFHYEHDGINQFGDTKVDTGTDGFDNDLPGQPGYGIVDDPGEMETSPPYPVPLRGIQIKIRVFEPDSRQIREVTVVQDFLPK